MFEFEYSGKNVEKAIEEGLNKLNLDKDSVDIKILDTGGFFKKARVKLIVSDEICNNSEEIKKLLTLSNIEKKINNPEEKQSKINKLQPEIKEDIKQNKQKIQEKENIKLEDSPEKANIEKSNQYNECEKFLQGLIKISKIDAYVNGSENENEIVLEVKGKYLSRLVGIKGQGLNAIQYLLSTISSKHSRNSKRVNFDIDGYKSKRKLSLENLANRMAQKVMETKEKISLKPMPAYERRIVHTIIQEYPKLVSISTGDEPYRVLTIDIKK